MKRVIRKALVCCVIGIFAIDASQALAWSREGKGKAEDHAEKMEKLTQELGLSQEQKDALKAQWEASKANKEALRQEVKEARTSLKEALKQPVTDRATVNAAAARVKSAQGIRVDQRVESFLAMKEILTPEQFGKMMEMKKDRAEKRERKRKDKNGSEEENL